MMLPFEGALPTLGRDVFVAPNATLIGKVAIGAESSVWFGSVLRGDVGSIAIGARTNVQDFCMIHMSYGTSDTHLGDDVTVGHGVILHGCTVGHRSLVGMGSIVLDNVEIGEDCVIGAGTLLPPRVVIPPRSLVLGSPGKVIRAVTDAELKSGRDTVERYLALARSYR